MTWREAAAASCPELEADLALYLEGDLPSEEEPRVAGHLAGCARCQGFLDGLRRSQGALKGLRSEDVDQAAFDAVRARVLGELEPGSRRRATSWNRWAAVGLAAGILLMVAGVLVLRGARSRPISTSVEVRVSPPPSAATLITPASKAPEATHAPATAPRRQRPSRPAVVRAPVQAPTVVATAPRAAATSAQPLVIKLLTDDPDVVIYWLVGEDEKGEER
jgi:anti-sigma factor RsiW